MNDILDTSDQANDDPRFIRQNGFLIFTGEIEAREIPDHRNLREERLESLRPD